MSTSTKRGLESFVGYLKCQRNSFRSDIVRASCDRQAIESEFHTIKQRTDPLIKSLGMPQRDSTGRRQARMAGRPPEVPNHRTEKSSEIEEVTSVQSHLPWMVIRFSGEKYTHFKAKATNTHVGRSYPSAFTRLKSRQNQRI